MERKEALKRLRELEGKDLHQLAKNLEVTVRTPTGSVNKGWAGHVIERYLGLPLNSAQSPNFGSWELKTVPLKTRKDGTLAYKETMAITMIDPYNVKITPFAKSHLLAKLQKFVLVLRTVGTDVDEPSFVVKTASIDLSPDVLKKVEEDYNVVRDCLNDSQRGFEYLTGSMGEYIQPRTKGSGHGSTNRAFYARPKFLNLVVPLDFEN
jgi:DNA mismatch repair protein MutH